MPTVIMPSMRSSDAFGHRRIAERYRHRVRKRSATPDFLYTNRESPLHGTGIVPAKGRGSHEHAPLFHCHRRRTPPPNGPPHRGATGMRDQAYPATIGKADCDAGFLGIRERPDSNRRIARRVIRPASRSNEKTATHRAAVFVNQSV